MKLMRKGPPIYECLCYVLMNAIFTIMFSTGKDEMHGQITALQVQIKSFQATATSFKEI